MLELKMASARDDENPVIIAEELLDNCYKPLGYQAWTNEFS